MSTGAPSPLPIVLIHGMWMTPLSWEHWIERYEAKGLRVIAPAYPGFDIEVEALNADPTPIERVTVPAIIEHLEAVVSGLESPPIIIGHSAGGVFTQILLDHGFGAVGVAIDSLDDMAALFDGISLDRVSTSMTINATAIILLSLYVAVAKRQGVDLRKLSGTVQNDILKEYVARGTYIYPPRPSLRIVTLMWSPVAKGIRIASASLLRLSTLTPWS